MTHMAPEQFVIPCRVCNFFKVGRRTEYYHNTRYSEIITIGTELY